MIPATIDPLEVFGAVPPADLVTVANAELARRSFAEFFRQWWRWKYPTRELVWNWHIDCIAEYLEAVSARQIQFLMINIPPRQLKSSLVSAAYPCWDWLKVPERQFIATSAIEKVMIRDAKTHLQTVSSPWYRQTFGIEWTLDQDQKAKTNFQNTAGGHRLSVTTGARITGGDADTTLIDDPIDISDAYNDKRQLVTHTRYCDETLGQRVNDEATHATIGVMQRSHERDYSGHIEGRPEWTWLILPAEYDGKRRFTDLGRYDPRTVPGEVLHPTRLHPDVLARKLRTLGSRAYSGQYQQQPSPESGTLWRTKWCGQHWTTETLPVMDYIVTSWDCTYHKTSDSDFVVGQAWGVLGDQRYLLDQVRRKMDLTETLQAMRIMLGSHIGGEGQPYPTATVVELKANGRKVVATLEREIPGLQGFDPQGSSKEERANAVLPVWENLKVWLPHVEHMPWVREAFLPEILSFPSGRHDDQVDAMTQALIYIQETGPIVPYVRVLG